jgi:hypothetical protein
LPDTVVPAPGELIATTALGAGAGAITAVGDDVAVVVPLLFVAVTEKRIVDPTSADVSRYVVPEPGVSGVQEPPVELQLSQAYA